MENKVVKDKKRYNLASALSRTIVRFLDLLVIIIFLVVIFFSFFSSLFLNDLQDQNTFYNIESWKIFLFTLVIFLSFFIYFIIVPFLTKGYTLFSWVFKIRIYSVSLQIVNEKRKIFKNIHFLFFVQIFIREIFVWFVTMFSILVLGVISFFDKKDVINFITRFVGSQEENLSNPISIIFSSIFTITALIDLGLIFNVALTSKKKSFTDYISNTVVVKMVETFSSDKNGVLNLKEKKKPKIKYNLPGEIINPDEIFNENNEN